MKKSKLMIFLLLSMIFMILLVVPVANAAMSLPGLWGEGEYGLTCYCPYLFFWNCHCYIEF